MNKALTLKFNLSQFFQLNTLTLNKFLILILINIWKRLIL